MCVSTQRPAAVARPRAAALSLLLMALPPLLTGCATTGCVGAEQQALKAGQDADAAALARQRCQARMARMQRARPLAPAPGDPLDRREAFINRSRAKNGLP